MDSSSLTSRLKGFRRRKRMSGPANALVRMCYASAAWLALWHYSDWLLHLPAPLRLAGVGATLVGLAAAAVILIRSAKGGNDRCLASELEGKYPELRQELSTVVQYSGQSTGRDYSDQLIGELTGRVGERLAQMDPKRAYPVNIFPFGRSAALALLGLGIAALIRPGEISVSWQRYLTPGAVIGDWRRVEIRPGPARVARGGQLAVEAGLERSGQVEVRFGGRVKRYPLQGADGIFKFKLENIGQDLTYRILVGRLQSPSFNVKCYDDLLLSDLRISVRPPAYSGLPERTIEEQGLLAVLRGSLVSLTARASLPLAGAGLRLDQGRVEAIVNDRVLNAKLKVMASQPYRFWARSLSGDTLSVPLAGRIDCLADRRAHV